MSFVAVMKHSNQKQLLGGEAFCSSHLQVTGHHHGKPSQEIKQETRKEAVQARFLTCLVSFLILQDDLPPEWYHP